MVVTDEAPGITMCLLQYRMWMAIQRVALVMGCPMSGTQNSQPCRLTHSSSTKAWSSLVLMSWLMEAMNSQHRKPTQRGHLHKLPQRYCTGLELMSVSILGADTIQ